MDFRRRVRHPLAFELTDGGMFGAAHKDHVEGDMTKMDDFGALLLGPDAIVKEEKTEWGPAGLAVLDGLVGENTPTLSEVGRMTSYASRCAVLCAQMRPLVGARRSEEVHPTVQPGEGAAPSGAACGRLREMLDVLRGHDADIN
jgi:hypothetical protein